jgi:hypothetical protein
MDCMGSGCQDMCVIEHNSITHGGDSCTDNPHDKEDRETAKLLHECREEAIVSADGDGVDTKW